MDFISFIKRRPILRILYKSSILPRAKLKYRLIKDLLSKEENILDIGCGNGGVLFLLQQNDYDASGIDVKDHNFYPSNQVSLYDGKNMLKSDKSIDKGLLLTVLHHTSDPEAVLKEAARVCKHLIIIEDVFTSALNKRLLFFVDSLVNFEWKGHPHTNLKEKDWEEMFEKLDFKINLKRTHTILLFFKQVTYSITI